MALPLALHRDLCVLPKMADSEPPGCPHVPLATQGLLCLVPRQLSLNFSTAGGRRDSQLLFFSATNLSSPGKDGCAAFHPTRDQVMAQREPWCLLHPACALHSRRNPSFPKAKAARLKKGLSGMGQSCHVDNSLSEEAALWVGKETSGENEWLRHHAGIQTSRI